MQKASEIYMYPAGSEVTFSYTDCNGKNLSGSVKGVEAEHVEDMILYGQNESVLVSGRLACVFFVNLCFITSKPKTFSTFLRIKNRLTKS